MSVPELNDYIKTQVMDSTNVSLALANNRVCPLASTLVDSLRYQITMYCSSRVNVALEASCNSSIPSAPFCLKECEDARISFVNIIKNGTACPNGQALSSVAQAHQSICDQAKLNTAKCILTDSEVSKCGITYLIYRFQDRRNRQGSMFFVGK